MPGMPRRWMSCCCFGVISRFSQTKPFFDDSRSRTSPVSRSGSVAVRSSIASSLSMMRRGSPNRLGALTSVARISPLRSTMSGRAVAIASCAAVRRAPWLSPTDREHHQPAADHGIDRGERQHGKADAGARLGGAIDVAPVQQAADQPLPPAAPVGLTRLLIGHRRSSGAGTEPVTAGASAAACIVSIIAPIGSGSPGLTRLGGRSGRFFEVVIAWR